MYVCTISSQITKEKKILENKIRTHKSFVTNFYGTQQPHEENE